MQIKHVKIQHFMHIWIGFLLYRIFGLLEALFLPHCCKWNPQSIIHPPTLVQLNTHHADCSAAASTSIFKGIHYIVKFWSGIFPIPFFDTCTWEKTFSSQFPLSSLLAKLAASCASSQWGMLTKCTCYFMETDGQMQRLSPLMWQVFVEDNEPT